MSSRSLATRLGRVTKAAKLDKPPPKKAYSILAHIRAVWLGLEHPDLTDAEAWAQIGEPDEEVPHGEQSSAEKALASLAARIDAAES